jgi:16S rRNA (uracil1498-N3)-methyltransferase
MIPLTLNVTIMRRRFLADEIRGDTAFLTGQNALHLSRVLRARVGQEFEIAANGSVRLGEVTTVSDEQVEFRLGEAIDVPETVPVALLLAVFKFDRFEWAVEKATELGVASIVPLIARRTDAHLAHASLKRAERWRRLAREAAQQSRRVSPPEISDPIKLKDALKTTAGTRVLLSESEDHRMLRDVFQEKPSSLALAVGPEGGWTDEEVEQWSTAGWVSVSLGPSILRAETAAIAALAVANALLS